MPVASLALGLLLLPAASLGDDPSRGVQYSFAAGPEVPPPDCRVGPRLSAAGLVGLDDLSRPWELQVGLRASLAVHEFAEAEGVTKEVNRWLRLVDVVPTARVRYALSHRFQVYGEYGLGLFYVFYFDPFVRAPTDIFSFTVQLAGGVVYAIGPRLALVGELRAALYTKSGGSLFVSPTVGVEFH